MPSSVSHCLAYLFGADHYMFRCYVSIPVATFFRGIFCGLLGVGCR